MNYDLLTWLHSEAETDPNLILYEYDADGAVHRMLEVFVSGKVVLKVPAKGQVSVVHGDYPQQDLEETPSILRFQIDRSAFDKVLDMVTQTEAV